MAKYMTQKASSGTLPAITYYRKQSAHPSHTESGQFTTDLKTNYANKYNIKTSAVALGTYKSGQGIPTGGITENI